MRKASDFWRGANVTSAGIVLTHAELAALDGLPLPVRCLYAFGIRPRKDFATGRVGDKPRISWQALKESLYVEPHPGRKTRTFSIQQVRRMAPWLVKAGLVKILSSKMHLIFFLPLAKRDPSAQEKADIM